MCLCWIKDEPNTPVGEEKKYFGQYNKLGFYIFYYVCRQAALVISLGNEKISLIPETSGILHI